ncbi:MAG TPA: TonB-dependent receptor [Steroidobacteraceae bacterium]|nr:TonB-dependent receptor [Steroidobacteraceae bacterium]
MNTANNHKRLRLLSMLAGLCGIGAVSVSLAQTSNSDAGTLDEVVVTAFKQGTQSVQAVPSSILVMGADRLADMGVTNFADFARAVPGLNFVDSGPGDKRYVIRGINSAGEAQTALYIDNIPLTGIGGAATDFGGSQADLDLYDVHQIEVLRGPQGTLYGANSQSGVIRFVTNQPDPSRFEASALADFSDTKGGGWNYMLKGMVNLPLVDGKVAVRLVGYGDDLSGFIDNPLRGLDDYNVTHQSGGRASVKWQIGEDTSLLGQVFYQHLYSGGQPIERPYGFAIGSNFFPADGAREYSQFSSTPRYDDVKIYALTGQHNFGWSDLTVATSLFDRSITDYQDDTTSFRFFEYLQGLGAFPPFAVPAGGVSVSPENTRLFSTEVRLNTKFDGPINGVVGVYYDDRDNKFSTNVFATDPATGNPQAATQIDERNFKDITKDFAVFGEATWRITPRLSLLGGLRYYDDTRDLTSATQIPFFGLGAPGVDPPEHAQNTGTTAKVNLSYHLTEQALVYAQYAEGFRAGGTNAATVSLVPGQYDPDTTRNYEIGAKTSWLSNRLTANVAVYKIDIFNMQVAELFGAGGAFSGVGNAAGKDAESKGVELDVTARPIDGLVVVLGGNYTDAKLTKDLSGATDASIDVGSLAVKGTPLLNVPKWNASLSADYNFPLTADYRASVGGDAEYTGTVQQTSYDNEPYANFNVPLPAYTLVNLRASVYWKEYQAQLYVTNAFDRNAEINALNDVDDAYNIITNRPRTVGVRLSGHF